MWSSGCSIASDDENSRHSFLSDCGSEFDLKPQPRYPAQKRSYLSITRPEPPMTRSRAKATGQTVITPEPELLPKPKRQSAIRRSMDAFNGMATTLTNTLNNNSILFSNQETTTDVPRNINTPLDGVNILADKFESCSIDEEQLNQNCLWPSRETNSHYMRPINSSSSNITFGSTPFSTFNPSPPLFAQSSIPTVFGQQQAQLWTRFRFAASSLRDNTLIESADLTLQQVPSNIFTSNQNTTNPFHFTEQFQMISTPQTVPTRLMTFQPRTIEDSSSSILTQRKITSINDSIPSQQSSKEEITIRQSSFASKLFFTLIIFVIGLVFGYLLTNTLPLGMVLETCVNYFHLLYVYVQAVFSYFLLAK